VKIGVLGWDRGDEDPDSPGLAEAGRRFGHDTSLFVLDEVSYAAAASGLRVLLGGEPAESFDAVICRANLYGDWHTRPFTGWEERLERLQSVSAVLGPRMFDPADVWFAGYSKFLTAQRLAAAGIPVPPTRSARSLADVAAAVAEWGPTVVKPSFGLRAMDVERVNDPADPADAAVVERLLGSYGALLCMPFYPTEFGEFRLTVAGEARPIDMLKLPAYGSWRVKTLEGASFERLDTPPELADLAVRAARAMRMTLAGLDILPTPDGYGILEVNPVAGFLNIFGEGPRQEVFTGVYDWIEKRAG
jgi:glutathione synthase/RimK-type ligase-like ATP-grasp enzyme